jgi:hypothetical protein
MSTYVTTGNIAYPPTGNITIAGSGAGSSYTLNTGAGVGGSGSFLVNTGAITGSTTATTYTTSWSQPNTNFNNSNGKTLMHIPHDGNEIVLEKSATLEVKGNIVMNGVDLDERLQTIEKVLNIPTRDVTMENKHPKLAELYKQYMHELEKYRTWDRIKGEEDGTT